MLVDDVVARVSIPITKSIEQRRSLEHIDVILKTKRAKERMPSHKSFDDSAKYDGGIFGVTLIMPVQTFRAVLPLPMHAMN